MTAQTPTAPGRGGRSGYRHPETPYEWSNAVHRGTGPRLHHRLRAVAWALADRAQLEGGALVCWPSLTTIATDAGMDRSNVARHLREIEAAGWIVRESGGPRRSTRYQLVIPDGVSVVAPARLVAPVRLVDEPHQVVADAPLGSGPSATSVVAPARHEVSIEVPTEVSREVRAVPHVSNAGASNREPHPGGPAVPVDGWRLVRAAIPEEHPQATRTALALEAGTLLAAGTPSSDVDAALRLWLTKPNLGPRTLPSLVSEVIKTHSVTARPGSMRGSEAIDAGVEAARILAAAQTRTAVKELE